jgi:hypothetical protein
MLNCSQGRLCWFHVFLVSPVSSFAISWADRNINAKGTTVASGDFVTVTGSGRVITGQAETAIPKMVDNADAVGGQIPERQDFCVHNRCQR